MSRMVRGLPLLTAALTACLAAGPARAQALPPQPIPVAPPAPAGAGPVALPPTTGLTPPPVMTPPPPPPVYRDPLPTHDALLDPPSAPPGWFGAVELGILKPHVKNRLIADVSFGDAGIDTVHLPGASLDWVVAPHFELGYRLADGFGELLLSYRYLTSEGHADVVNFDTLGDGVLRSRLDLNVFDFDYASREIALGARWDMKWRVGVRLADVFFDSRAVGQFLGQRTSNHFIGAGPHAGLDLRYHFSLPGLALFARLEGALPIGRIHQGFEETFVFDDGSASGSATSQGGTQAVPTLNVRVGLGWQPPGTRLRFDVGYQYEQWWYLGHVGDSRGELFDQGAFFRGEFSF